MESNSEETPADITPCDSDVLLGRGNQVNFRKGNKHFRSIVQARALNYTTSQDRREKDRIAMDVVTSVERAGGRFLRAQNSGDNTRWYIVSTDNVLTKVKQALRDSAAAMTREQHRVEATGTQHGKRIASASHSYQPSLDASLVASSRPVPSGNPMSNPNQRRGLPYTGMGNVLVTQSQFGQQNHLQQMAQLQSSQLQHLSRSLQQNAGGNERLGTLLEQQRAILASQIHSPLPSSRQAVDLSFQDALLGIQMTQSIRERQQISQRQPSTEPDPGVSEQRQASRFPDNYMIQQQQFALASQQQRLLAQQQRQDQFLSRSHSTSAQPQAPSALPLSRSIGMPSSLEPLAPQEESMAFPDMLIPDPVPIREPVHRPPARMDASGLFESHAEATTGGFPDSTSTIPREPARFGEHTARMDRLSYIEETKQDRKRKAPPEEDPKS